MAEEVFARTTEDEEDVGCLLHVVNRSGLKAASDWINQTLNCYLRGGLDGSLMMDAGAARNLMYGVRRYYTQEGGSLLVITSRNNSEQRGQSCQGHEAACGSFKIREDLAIRAIRISPPRDLCVLIY